MAHVGKDASALGLRNAIQLKEVDMEWISKVVRLKGWS